jgi:hypothetical protein
MVEPLWSPLAKDGANWRCGGSETTTSDRSGVRRVGRTEKWDAESELLTLDGPQWSPPAEGAVITFLPWFELGSGALPQWSPRSRGQSEPLGAARCARACRCRSGVRLRRADRGAHRTLTPVPCIKASSSPQWGPPAESGVSSCRAAPACSSSSGRCGVRPANRGRAHPAGKRAQLDRCSEVRPQRAERARSRSMVTRNRSTARNGVRPQGERSERAPARAAHRWSAARSGVRPRRAGRARRRAAHRAALLHAAVESACGGRSKPAGRSRARRRRPGRSGVRPRPVEGATRRRRDDPGKVSPKLSSPRRAERGELDVPVLAHVVAVVESAAEGGAS